MKLENPHCEVGINREMSLLGEDDVMVVGTNRRYCLPHYLQPGSGMRDFGELVDDTTPVQRELGACPFGPEMWDDKRWELVRKLSAIYGQNSTKRKP